MPNIKEGGINVTPLIDVVMCLIIFFMLAAKIGISTGAEPMDLPAAFAGGRIEDMGNTLLLNVRQGPGNTPYITALVRDKQQELKLADTVDGRPASPLRDVLSEFRRIKGEEFRIIIRGERNMPYQCLEPVLIACAEAKVRKVNFNTREMANP